MNRPGDAVKALFRLFLIDATPECLCHKRCELMNLLGHRWCLANLPVIVDWLEEEAKGRNMAFDRVTAGRMVGAAIRRSMSPEMRKSLGVKDEMSVGSVIHMGVEWIGRVCG